MKKMMILATTVAMMLAVMPVQAQSNKDKKAAKKAQWEMEQQQKREEAELRHQIRMDSLRNAQQSQAEARKRAQEELDRQDAERRAAEDAAKARLEKEEAKAEQQAKRTRKAVVLPCKGVEYKTNDAKLRSFASREGLDTDAAQQAAYISARNQLAGMIEVSIQSLSADYLKSQEKQKTKEQERRLETLTMQTIERFIRMAPVACEEYESYFDKEDNEVFVCYMVVEIEREAALNSLHKNISAQESDLIQSDYDKFKQEFKEHFAKEEEKRENAEE